MKEDRMYSDNDIRGYKYMLPFLLLGLFMGMEFLSANNGWHIIDEYSVKIDNTLGFFCQCFKGYYPILSVVGCSFILSSEKQEINKWLGAFFVGAQVTPLLITTVIPLELLPDSILDTATDMTIKLITAFVFANFIYILVAKIPKYYDVIVLVILLVVMIKEMIVDYGYRFSNSMLLYPLLSVYLTIMAVSIFIYAYKKVSANNK